MKASIAIAFLGLSLSAAPFCAAQSFPSKPITIVIPFGAGGNPDLIARVLQPKMSETLGVPIVIENKPGAGGNIGTAVVAKALPDGYTIGLGTVGALTVNKWISKSMPFDPAAFAPIILLGTSPNVLMTTPSLNVKTVRELVETAKAKPGQLTFASPGIGTSLHMAGELFKSRAGVFITHIPYRSGPDAFADVVSGRVDMTFENIVSAGRVAQEGKLVPLAVTSMVRSSLLPNVPTLHESGLNGFDVTAWLGLIAPPGTPTDVVQRLNAAAASALREPAIVERLQALGFVPAGGTPADFGSFVKKETAKWGEVAKRADIRAE
ncbi:Bug family tripartite tricarboxylate transporter substrate binding protein [Variovorax paradoxus]|uniref:Tripartite tricarboxylate transporter family receptor n=1 Tax=Variovorax paradoxus TaxID=34073 RepID=A0A0H2LWA0_VARPD|nr:tripartite tricarboxylate transporter substrate binding protein [Variovorax paradoxus]KLN52812.1 tripartite tricarboxylate transporter family receptor [Variovorax paradoxus]